MGRLGLFAGIAMLIATTAAFGQEKEQGLIGANEIKWGPAPASLPPGAQAAVLEGDPAKEGPFTLRVRMPDGYRIPPHYHPAVEHVTVLQGTFILGMGAKASDEARALGVGSFAFMPAGMRHFARTQGDTVVQLHGIGPWGITYVNPADDPRKSK